MSQNQAQYSGGYDPQTAEQAQNTMSSILARSAADQEFRAKLLSDPRAAIAEFCGRDVSAVPADLNVRFIESRGAKTVVLPDFAGTPTELAEHELEAVAGGVTPALVGAAVGIEAALIIHRIWCEEH